MVSDTVSISEEKLRQIKSSVMAFKHDLRWFARFLERYNGVSMYTHRKIDHVVELDTCLDGIGAVWKNYVYHLPIPTHYLILTIVHLEMINILVAIKAFGPFWAQKKVLVKFDNQAVVSVLKYIEPKMHSWLLVPGI